MVLQILPVLIMAAMGVLELSSAFFCRENRNQRESRFQRFQRQHVDSESPGGTDSYCNMMVQRRGIAPWKHKNTFIHEDLQAIQNICTTPNVRCKKGWMNCHEGIARVTDCEKQGSTYRATGSTRPIVIACEGNPLMPVHFDK